MYCTGIAQQSPHLRLSRESDRDLLRDLDLRLSLLLDLLLERRLLLDRLRLRLRDLWRLFDFFDFGLELRDRLADLDLAETCDSWNDVDGH